MNIPHDHPFKYEEGTAPWQFFGTFLGWLCDPLKGQVTSNNGIKWFLFEDFVGLASFPVAAPIHVEFHLVTEFDDGSANLFPLKPPQ